jgi:hypothetical protein
LLLLLQKWCVEKGYIKRVDDPFKPAMASRYLLHQKSQVESEDSGFKMVRQHEFRGEQGQGQGT